eukprot:scaffold4522_cov130-Amphora_coffeaeformis.AAC.8
MAICVELGGGICIQKPFKEHVDGSKTVILPAKENSGLGTMGMGRASSESSSTKDDMGVRQKSGSSSVCLVTFRGEKNLPKRLDYVESAPNKHVDRSEDRTPTCKEVPTAVDFLESSNLLDRIDGSTTWCGKHHQPQMRERWVGDVGCGFHWKESRAWDNRVDTRVDKSWQSEPDQPDL